MQSHFITLCCANRQSIFANAKHANWIVGRIQKVARAQCFAIDAYCVMPDHVHLLLSGLGKNSDLLNFVRNFKLASSREYRKAAGAELWQKKFYDHILRQADSMTKVAGYIWMNPVRKSLCTDPRDYAYSGSLVIDWKHELAPLEAWNPP